MDVLFDIVRERASAREVAQVYGLIFGHNGRACCPWHQDTHPDLAFYDDGTRCYCHACHAGGDSIALAAQLFGLSPLDAARKLNADFRLNVNDCGYVPPIGPSRAQLRREVEAWRNHRFCALCEVEAQARQTLAHMRGDWDDPRFRRTLKALALVQDDLNALQAATVDDLIALKEGELRDCGRISA